MIDLDQGRCIHEMCDMGQLLAPEYFIPSHVNVQDCTIEDKSGIETLSIDYNDVNKAQDFFLKKIKRCQIVHKERAKKELEDDEHKQKEEEDSLEGGYVQEILVGAFKTYNENDYHELLTLAECLEDGKPTRKLDLESVLSLYCGIPIFAMQTHTGLYSAIEKSLEATDLRPKTDL